MRIHSETHMEQYERCDHCNTEFSTESEKQEHITQSHPEPTAPPLQEGDTEHRRDPEQRIDSQYTCDECDYQTIQEQQLLEHIEMRHRAATVPVENTEVGLFKCRDCANKFPNYNSMMKHRKQKHPRNCRNFPKGTCRFDANECYFMHPEVSETTESVTTTNTAQTENPFKCHTCGDQFASKNQMMRHKKAQHTNNLPCRDFPNCRRSAEDCWYKHESNSNNFRPVGLTNPSASSPNAPSSAPPQEGFWETSPQQNPPDQLTQVLEMLKVLQQEMNMVKSEVQTLKQ